MIKSRNMWLFLQTVLVMLALISGTIFAGDRNERKAFTAESWFIAYLDPGTITFPDGMTHIRDQVILVEYRASDPRISGYYKGVFNYNLDSRTRGVLYGSAQKVDANGDPVDGSGFVGECNGKVYEVSALTMNSTSRCVYHGTGANMGLRFEVTEAWDMDLTDPYPYKRWYATMVGEIQGTAKK